MTTPPLFAEDQFQQYFEIFYAKTPELKERIFRLRYDVYCREFHYEQEENCPGGLEQDDYDVDAQQVLTVHRSSETAAGCLRMITPPPADLSLLLPLERHCGHTLNHPERHPQLVPRHLIAEISRLAVHTSFRRRLGEGESPLGVLEHVEEQERRTFPLISLALLAGTTALLALSGRQHMFVMVEPRFARRMHSLGFPFVQIGTVMDYHGKRAAYHMTVEECLNSWNDTMLRMYDFILTSLQKTP
ncbi:PEP-CTERM/exosortase system-associated acyltransferase [Rhodoferax sp. 4810]|uniref:PEP-CTERM/exosortase system-associated acyltransferase n=1 Tax=Thiospirillum jenense TaxID=1653858 RepID=A0A839HEP1_9GAMM|nr:PEP-CTERM/exosortase system-associated acyltransferase [Thiospirillum jenense]MBB1073980.1 PEP-CTERM/exosortase system-associated acyltransferase [Rhodoferax jenense]MBB1125856.1 PEP-CTERM/exosortase system-associated acyltransferase [Thiospirillum jenense]